MASYETYKSLPAAMLTEMQNEFATCLREIVTAGKSYMINNRSYTRADMKEVSEQLEAINTAISLQSGTTRKFASARHY